MSTEWKHFPYPTAEAVGCKVWERDAALGTIYYVTRTGLPPQLECGGFYRLSTALWVVDIAEGL